MSPATAAIAWVLANPHITAPIVGASRAEQLKDSLTAVTTPLDPAFKKALDELSAEYRRGDALV
jgi:aryl-alcohol dehydrogenase-like predicted oxidoreductase